MSKRCHTPCRKSRYSSSSFSGLRRLGLRSGAILEKKDGPDQIDDWLDRVSRRVFQTSDVKNVGFLMVPVGCKGGYSLQRARERLATNKR